MKPLDEPSATLSHPFDISTLAAEGGALIAIDADEKQRGAVAKRLGVSRVDHLRGDFRLTPAAGGVDLNLRLHAAVERQCVVSLEPMMETVREDIAIKFENAFAGDERIAPDLDSSREPLEGDVIDLGEILVQHLSLSLDPHPRKKGADCLLAQYRDAASPSPFESLKGLVDPDRQGRA